MTEIKVLFVDDEQHWLNALRRSLCTHHLPWNMEFVNSGFDALERLSESQFDVLVSDLNMPGLRGDRLLEQVTRRHPEIVQVMLSAAAEGEFERRRADSSVQFLSKTGSTEDLIKAIERGLTLKRFFQGTSFRNLIKRLESLEYLPEIDIRIRHSEKLGGYAEVSCPLTGLQFRLLMKNTDIAELSLC